MKRIISVLAVAALMAALMVVMAAPAFAKAHERTGLGKELHSIRSDSPPGDNGWHGKDETTRDHGTHGLYNWGIGNDP